MDIIGYLPIEIAQEIFHYLNASDLSNCCRVSKIWRNLVNTDSLWRDICLRKGIICDLEYYSEGWWELEPMVDWAHAYMAYVKKRINNWRRNRRLTTTIHSCYDTIACSNGKILIFTNASQVIFVYDITRRKPFCLQIIQPECIDKEIISLDLTNDYLIARCGDSFVIYFKQKEFILKGYLLRYENSYIFTRRYNETNEGFGCIRYCVINDAICILINKSIYICTLNAGIEIRSILVTNESFLLHDRFRAYAVTDDKTISSFDSNLNFIDFTLNENTILALKSNKYILIALITKLNSIYEFKIWNLNNLNLIKFDTHRPFGFEVHPKLNLFTSVSLDKFNQRVLLKIYDLNLNLNYEIDLNDLTIAQVKLCFIGRNLLYCATRSDWDIYDTTYVIDLVSMQILYEADIGQMCIVSVDSKHAIYLHGEAIEVHTYID